MRIVGIPARYGSTRFPGKLLAEIKGKPIIVWVVESVLKVRNARVIVATDNNGIREAVKDLCEVILTPEDLPSGTDRLAYALRDIEDNAKIVNVQGDEPFIKPEVIEFLFDMMENEDADIYTLAKRDKMDKNPNRVKVVLDSKGYALYFSRSPIPYNSKESLIHIGLYGYTKEKLLNFSRLPKPHIEETEKLEQLRALYYGWKVKVGIVEYEGISIDTPEDLEIARKMLE